MFTKLIWIALMLSAVPSVTLAHKCEQDSYEQSLWIEKPIDKRLERKLFELFACLDTRDKNEYKLIDRTACNWFAAKALSQVWGFLDFQTPSGFLSANELADRLSEGNLTHWRVVGSAVDQKANDEAAAMAASGHPVVAVWKAPPGTKHGHVAIILPGGVVPSAWGVRVPRAAQMSLDHPNDAFIGCRVSSAFGEPKKSDVKYYSRDLVK